MAKRSLRPCKLFGGLTSTKMLVVNGNIRSAWHQASLQTDSDARHIACSVCSRDTKRQQGLFSGIYDEAMGVRPRILTWCSRASTFGDCRSALWQTRRNGANAW